MKYVINTKATNGVVNEELKVLRATDKQLALNIRKAYNSMLNKEFTELPQVPEDLVQYMTNKNVAQFVKPAIANAIFNLIQFSEEDDCCTEEVKTPVEVATAPLDLDTVTPAQLTQVLFDDLGTEIQAQIQAMTTGLKLKLDLLDELKAVLKDTYPDMQSEVLTEKLANALAVTKMKVGSSLALKEGSLTVYDYMKTDIVTDSKNFEFMASLDADKTKSLEILILQSAFRSYKEQVAQGNLPATAPELNLAIAKAISGIQQTTEATKAKLADLF